MNRFLIALLVVTTTAGSCMAQQKSKRPDYKLLWKISGKDLKRPSYLFGTMHVQDNKAFDFSDSVLLKISECEAFALEFHPDSVTRFVLDLILGSGNQQKNRFTELLGTKEYKRLDSLMVKRTGYSLKKFTGPSRAKYFLQNRDTKKDKRTFLDAWLYNIAREQNKVIIGLEDSKSQFEILDRDPAEDLDFIVKYLENNEDVVINPYQSLLDVYYRGDIDELRKITKTSTPEERYEQIITRRNLGMADNIKKEIHQHSTFIAVGAAHLPGEEGLIRLLQTEGYRVTLVQPRFTGLAAKHSYTVTEPKWVTYASGDGGYTIEMPQQPVAFKPDSLPLTFQTYFDIGTPAMYMTTHFAIGPEFKGQTSAKILDTMEKNLKQKTKPEYSSKIKVQGNEGREMGFITNDQFFKVQLIHRGSVVYMLMAGPSREFTRGAEAAKFFSSFRTVAFQQKETHDFVNKEGAFSIAMPGKVIPRVLNPNDPGTGERYTLNLFHTTNAATGETFLLRYNDFPVGYVSSDDSVYYANMVETIMAPLKGTRLQHYDTTILGFKGHAFTFTAGENVQVRGNMVLRGNRYYLTLTTTAALESSLGSHEFLRSLRFLPYETTRVKQTEFPDGIVLTVPENFVIDSARHETEDGQVQYNILDNQTGIAYMVIVEKLSRYTESKKPEKFFDELMNTYADETDSIAAPKNTSAVNYVAHEADLVSKRINAIKRIKAILAGNKLFLLLAYLPADYQQSDFPEKFLNTFKIKNSSQWSVFDDKTDQILKDISSADSLTQAEAENAIRGHDFEKKDLPEIYKAIKRSYADDSEDYTSVKGKLLDVLKETNDESTLGFIRSIYNTLPDTTTLRDDALSVLSALKTRQSLAEMIRLLKEDKARSNFKGFTVLGGFYDSLALLNFVLPDLLKQESRFDHAFTLFDLTKTALDSGALTAEVKNKVIDEILAIGKNATTAPINIQKSDEDYEAQTSRFDALAGMLSAVPFTPEVKNMMIALQRSGDVATMMTTSLHLLKNNISLQSTDIDKIAADPLYRFRFYDAMKAIKKEKLINARYLTPVMMAESDFYEYMSYEDGVPEKTEFLKERKVVYEGEKQSLFVFRYRFEESESWQIGISGPYPAKSKTVPDRGEMTSSLYETYESEKQLNEMLTKFLAEYGAELKD